MAGGWGTTFANDLIKLVFQTTTITGIAVNDTGTPLTALFLSLHTASPSGGSQTTSEVTYTSYARKSISRASGAGGFTASTNTMNLTDSTNAFVAGTGGSGTATHCEVGTVTLASGAGKTLIWGTVTPNIVTGNGVTPQLTSATFLTMAV
jgi:hypothetical protein